MRQDHGQHRDAAQPVEVDEASRPGARDQTQGLTSNSVTNVMSPRNEFETEQYFSCDNAMARRTASPGTSP
jgi:hypothetical protein